ncbi:UNVERIFIED_CONTAM: hypothetical protein GTU68_035808 [Idotea baltica]|nr:hypothetical protein [Idotea baltica]MCL4163053.1 hypothetical protein [Idotea baltica]
MVMDLRNPIMSHDERKEKIKLLADYLVSSLHQHNCYSFKFFFCEFLNFMNAILNMWFLDKFLGGMFFSVGIDLLNYINMDQDERTDPLIVLFPRVTKCTFHMFGVSGTIERHDLMCVLALNVVNEKIYVFLWFWFILLAITSALGIIYRTIIYCLPVIRVGLLHKKAKMRYKDAVQVMSKHLQSGDCFLLHLLSKNIDFLAFNSLMEEMFVRFDSRHSTSGVNLEMASNGEQFGLMSSIA